MKKSKLILSLSGALFIFGGTLSVLAITKDEEKAVVKNIEYDKEQKVYKQSNDRIKNDENNGKIKNLEYVEGQNAYKLKSN